MTRPLPPSELVRAPQTEAAIAERKRLVLQTVRNTTSPTKAARALGIAPSNITYWKQTDPEFRTALAQADQDRKLARADLLEEVVFNLATGNPDEDGNPTETPHFGAAKFLLGKYAPEEWAEKIDHRYSGQIVHTHIPAARNPSAIPTVSEAEYRMLTPPDEDDDEGAA